MAKKSVVKAAKKNPASKALSSYRGEGDELHQTSKDKVLTTNQGIPVSDDQNSLKIGARGPIGLEDFVLREKITHFDHERIPERIVHARGSAAHGFFECLQPMTRYTRANFLQKKGARVPVFTRFSTVAGGAGSVDLPRDVRGFAVKFYTQEGNFDLVGNNIPVFFIQDPMKFPDLVHSVKKEPDRGYPEAASAHDTFWDFISLMPESMHMIMWAMSDRAIPRYLRTIEGFGVHTFRLVNAKGESTFVKFHWRPKLGLQSVVWDEAVKINGADNDFHRRDLFTSIDSGSYPEWELYFQLFTEADAAKFDFDVLDATKLIPEEIIPLNLVGRMVLNRNPDNFFAETEQVAFCPANVVPGIDFSDDPLLQGRLFSYLDTQLIRLGGPNHHQIPINAPKCPMHNFQRDGHMQTAVPTGRVSYEPNSLAPASERENPTTGFRTFERKLSGNALRVRPELFGDHYTQARMFYVNQTATEQGHIVSALVFELSKVETPAIRERVVSHLVHIDEALAQRVAKGLGLARAPAAAPTAVPPRKKVTDSPTLSILKKTRPTLEGRVVGCLVSDGVDAGLIASLRAAAKSAGAKVQIIAPTITGIETSDGATLAVDHILPGGASVLFDTVVLALGPGGAKELARESAAKDFVRDAHAHLKVIGFNQEGAALMKASDILPSSEDAGHIALDGKGAVQQYITTAKKHRIWDREPSVKKMI